ncbi:MAG: hypothetical protein DMF68_16535 [Acidobacteria bacterium]|nr:MAG: hypothetical protein DMF68_16535 [Acidobacteriota bacterium]
MGAYNLPSHQQRRRDNRRGKLFLQTRKNEPALTFLTIGIDGFLRKREAIAVAGYYSARPSSIAKLKRSLLR